MNVHAALPEACRLLRDHGAIRDSRNGKVKVLQEPLATTYYRPCQRVLLWRERDANPFFHLFEALWMLSGRNDVEFVAKYAKQMSQYSDDGATFNGAYGYRWRKHFRGRDQLKEIIEALGSNHTDRRQVLSMWDGWHDPESALKGSKDVPCNLCATFDASDGKQLNMTVFCRSNDLIWGCYGANAVHFSVLQEYLAAGIGLNVGTYTQISNNAHIYEKHWPMMESLAKHSWDGMTYREDPYKDAITETPVVDLPLKEWDDELLTFMLGGVCTKSQFFKNVAEPMRATHKARDPRWLGGTPPYSDWRVASDMWLANRVSK